MKLKKKNSGNIKLIRAVDELIADFGKAAWKSKDEVLRGRRDADCVHSAGYFFFNIHIHRALVLVDYQPEGENEPGMINVHWAGSHDEYERVFRNNKTVIEKWLRNKGLIE